MVQLEQDVLKYFPYDEIRPEQAESIAFTLKAHAEGKRFIILELGTGVGKSAIAVALARYFAENIPNGECDPGGYFLTTQKILQEQYIRDFGGLNGNMVSIKSSTGYQCKRKKDSNCGEVRRLIKNNKDNKRLNKCSLDCVYVQAREAFKRSRLGVTNYSYFLSITKYTDEIEKPKQILILDEGHNLQDEISGFVDIQITNELCYKMGFGLPTLTDKTQAIEWVRRKFQPALTGYVRDLEEEMKDSNVASSLVHEHSFMDRYLCKLNRSLDLYTEDNWIMNFIGGDASKGSRVEFKPIDISEYTEDSLFMYGQTIIVMSATVLDATKYAQQVGIPLDMMASLKIESPFPAKNKPIVYAPMGRMTMDSIDTTLPKIAKAVVSILKRHPDMKGIIHCHSYKILNYLKTHVRDKRLLFQDQNNKEKILSQHHRSPIPTFLVSPSMGEGVDLKDDLSRVQIVCKLPFPYLGDQLVQKRKEHWSWWYNYETAKSLIQMFGRSIRNENDYAITYILDESWSNFYMQNHFLFPPSFSKQFV